MDGASMFQFYISAIITILNFCHFLSDLKFQFYISAIITIGRPEPRGHHVVSILHKCDYNIRSRGFVVRNPRVSILHKCDYNLHSLHELRHASLFQFYISAIITHSCQRARAVLCAFQFYISAIITHSRCLCWNCPCRVSILHKCDYNPTHLVRELAAELFQFYISAIITRSDSPASVAFPLFQFYISAIITICPPSAHLD